MPPKVQSDEIIQQNHVRIFRQPGGASPGNPVLYTGKQTQYLMVGSVNRAIRGDVTPIFVPDPNAYRRFIQVGRTEEPPEFSTFDLTVLQKHGVIPFTLGNLECKVTFYLPVGVCKNPSDFNGGWTDFVYIFSNALATGGVDMGDITGWNSDNQNEHVISYTVDAIYAVGPISFGEKAALQIDREAIDSVFGSNIECGDCGPADDGTERNYTLVTASGAGSPGLPAEVVYTVDGFTTFGEATITGIGANVTPTAIEVVGDKLLVLVGAEDAYYWATINPLTGVPGAFTKVTSGFVAAGSPNDWYVLDANNIFIVGDAGYIYKLSQVGDAVTVLSAGTVTTQVLNRIDGDGENTIVIVGFGATIIKSLNRGVTFATTTAAPAVGSNSITGVSVVDASLFWVITSQGYVYYTENGGETWVLSWNQTGVGRDIVFVTQEVGYFSHDTAAPLAQIFGTVNGGVSWTNQAKRFMNLPVFNRANRIAVPTVGTSTNGMTTAANTLAIAGLSGGGTDGILLFGTAIVQ